MPENLIDKAKAATISLKEKASFWGDSLSEDNKNEIINLFKERGENKIDEIFSTLDQYKALFTEAGYKIGEVNVSLGLPPDISVSFEYLETISEAKRKEIQAKVIESKIANIILVGLFKASDYASKIKIGELKLSSITMTLGLIPSVEISLT